MQKSFLDREYPAEIVWACAAAADRINGGYRKHDNFEVDKLTSEIVEYSKNKTLVFRMLDTYKSNQLSKQTVTDQDHTDGAAARKFWQSQLLVLLDPNANEYFKACVTVSNRDTIELLVDVSIIASCITAAKREASQQQLTAIKFSLDSQHVGKIGDDLKMSENIQVIDCKYIDRVGASIVECIIDGNLYHWWSQRAVEVGEYKSLKARIKSHDVEYRTKQPITKLNYVRITK